MISSGGLAVHCDLPLALYFWDLGELGVVAFARVSYHALGGALCRLTPGTDRPKKKGKERVSHVPIWTGVKASDHAVRDCSIPETSVVGVRGGTWDGE